MDSDQKVVNKELSLAGRVTASDTMDLRCALMYEQAALTFLQVPNSSRYYSRA